MLTWLFLTLALALVTSAAIWSRYPTRARLLSVLAFLATAPLTGAILLANGGWAVTIMPQLPEMPAKIEVVRGVTIIVPDPAIHWWAYLKGSFEAIPGLPALPAETEILGVKIVPDEAIYVMLDVDGEPRLFKLPWNTEQASKLQRLIESTANGRGSITAKKGDRPDDYPVEFWATPQPSMPDKAPEAAGEQYERQG